MAKAFRAQLTDPNLQGMSFEDRFGLIVDQEWTSRKNSHLKRLIKQARFSDPEACVEDIEYHADRNLDQTQIARLSGCDYIAERHNVILLGATGSGKTYLACALGMSAIRNFLTVRYARLPDLQGRPAADGARVEPDQRRGDARALERALHGAEDQALRGPADVAQLRPGAGSGTDPAVRGQFCRTLRPAGNAAVRKA